MRKLQQPLKSACLGIKSRLNKNDSDAAHTEVISPRYRTAEATGAFQHHTQESARHQVLPVAPRHRSHTSSTHGPAAVECSDFTIISTSFKARPVSGWIADQIYNLSQIVVECSDFTIIPKSFKARPVSGWIADQIYNLRQGDRNRLAGQHFDRCAVNLKAVETLAPNYPLCGLWDCCVHTCVNVVTPKRLHTIYLDKYLLHFNAGVSRSTAARDTFKSTTTETAERSTVRWFTRSLQGIQQFRSLDLLQTFYQVCHTAKICPVAFDKICPDTQNEARRARTPNTHVTALVE